jgi:hypothetical protein
MKELKIKSLKKEWMDIDNTGKEIWIEWLVK